MSNILMASITIAGVRPILWHAFTPDAIPLVKGERSGVAGNDPEEWKRTVLTTTDGQLYLPQTAVFGCLREAARYTRRGRGSIQGALAATLQVATERVLIDRYLPAPITTDPTQPIYLDIRSVRNPATKARNVRYRVTASAGWGAEFSVLWDKTVVSRGELEAVLRDAGRLVGLGNARTIGYGRFAVNAFTVTELLEVSLELPEIIEHE